MNTILCACDFSQDAMSAAGIARDLAKASGAKIIMLHVARPRPIREIKDPAAAQPGLEAQRKLSEFADEVASQGVAAEALFVESAHISKTIISVAKEKHADMIVLGRSGLPDETSYAGPTVRKLLHMDTPPLLLARKMMGVPKIDRILTTTDMSEASLAGMRYAAQLSKTLSAQLEVLFIYEFVDIPPTSQEEADALDALVNFASSNGITGENISFKVISHTLPAQGITNYVTQNNIPLTVISTRGASGLEKWLLGSTTERVIKLCPWPIIVVKQSYNG